MRTRPRRPASPAWPSCCSHCSADGPRRIGSAIVATPEPHRSHTGATPSRDGGEFTDLRLALELERPQQVVLQKQLEHVVVHAKTCRRKTATPQPPKGLVRCCGVRAHGAVDGWISIRCLRAT